MLGPCTFSQPWDQIEMLLRIGLGVSMRITDNVLLGKFGRCFRHHEYPIRVCFLDVRSCYYSSCDAGAAFVLEPPRWQP